MAENVKKFVPNIHVDLREAEFSDDTKEVVATALTAGWSKNGRYYSEEVVETLPEFLMKKKKMYVNHSMRPVGDQRYLGGRDMRDWQAQITDAWYEDGKAKVKFFVFESEAWLYERIKKCPEEVGLSIDAEGYVSEIKKEGKKGYAVDKFIRLRSLDFVQEPAAGGKVDRLAAMYIGDNQELVDKVVEALDEYEDNDAVKSLKGFFEKIDKSISPKEAVESFIQEISKTEYVPKEFPKEAYIYVGDEDIPETWKYRYKMHTKEGLVTHKHTLLNSLRNLYWDSVYKESFLPKSDMMKIKENFRSACKEIGMLEEEYPSCIADGATEITIENIVDFENKLNEIVEIKKDNYPVSSFACIENIEDPETWKIRIKDGDGNYTKTLLDEALAEAEKLEKKDCASIIYGCYKSLGIDLPEILGVNINGGESIVEDLKELTVEKLTSLRPDIVDSIKEIYHKESKDKNEVENLKKETEKLTKEVDQLKESVKEKDAEIDKYKVAENLREHEKMVEKELAEAELNEKLLTDLFKKQLLEAKDEETVKALIKDRKAIQEGFSGQIKDLGPRGDKKDVKSTKKSVTEMDSKEFARNLIG